MPVKSPQAPVKAKPVKKKEEQVTRPILYPKYQVEFACKGYARGKFQFVPDPKADPKDNDSSLTMQRAKELLGWEEEPEGQSWDTWFLIDRNQKKVRLRNNDRNRRFRPQIAAEREQDVLTGDYAMNCQPVIISQTGLTSDAQHRLIGYIFACQRWHSNSEHDHWVKIWPTEPTIETMIVYGLSEDPKVTRTLDNTQPRDYQDTLLTDSQKFLGREHKEREELVRMLVNATKLVWVRTAEKEDPYCNNLTNATIDTYVNNHPHLEKFVLWVYKENQDGHITKVMSPGYAAGMLYLMACSGSKRKDYWPNGVYVPRTEEHIKFDRTKMAEEFWIGVITKTIPQVKEAIAALVDPNTGEAPSQGEKEALIARAWNFFIEKKKFTVKQLQLQYKFSYDGGKTYDTIRDGAAKKAGKDVTDVSSFVVECMSNDSVQGIDVAYIDRSDRAEDLPEPDDATRRGVEVARMEVDIENERRNGREQVAKQLEEKKESLKKK
jgi:hypothetical protein